MSRGKAARSPTVRTPRSCSRFAVAGPTPHSASTAWPCRNSSSSTAPRGRRPGPARVRFGWPGAWPPGRRAWRSFWSVRCRPRTPGAVRRAPLGAALGRCCRGPEEAHGAATSTNASSRPIGSTMGVTSARFCGARRSPRHTGRGARTRRSPLGTAGGHAPTAWPNAPRRPAPRRCTRQPPRAPAPPTITGFPAKEGSSTPPPTQRTRPCRCAGWWGGRPLRHRGSTGGTPRRSPAGPPALLGRPPSHRLAGPAVLAGEMGSVALHRRRLGLDGVADVHPFVRFERRPTGAPSTPDGEARRQGNSAGARRPEPRHRAGRPRRSGGPGG